MDEFKQVMPFEIEASPLSFQYEVTINEDFEHVKQLEIENKPCTFTGLTNTPYSSRASINLLIFIFFSPNQQTPSTFLQRAYLS